MIGLSADFTETAIYLTGKEEKNHYIVAPHHPERTATLKNADFQFFPYLKMTSPQLIIDRINSISVRDIVVISYVSKWDPANHVGDVEMSNAWVNKIVAAIRTQKPNAKVYFILNFIAVIGPSSYEAKPAKADRNSLKYAATLPNVDVIDWPTCWINELRNPTMKYTGDNQQDIAHGRCIEAALGAQAAPSPIAQVVFNEDNPCKNRNLSRRTTVGAVDPISGDDPSGDDPSGDDPSGDDPSGDDPPTTCSQLSSSEIKNRLSKYYMGQGSFSSVPFATDCQKSDGKTHTIKSDGCGVTAFSTVVSILYNKKITPKIMVDRGYTGKYKTQCSTDVNLLNTMVSNLKSHESGYSDLSIKKITPSKSTVDSELSKGHMVLMSCTGGTPCGCSNSWCGNAWSTKGHYIAIVGVDPNNSNNYLISNPGRSAYGSHTSWPKTTIINMFKGGDRARSVWRSC